MPAHLPETRRARVANGKVAGTFPVLKAGANQAKLTFKTKDSETFRVTVSTLKRY